MGLFTRDTEGAKLHGATVAELATVVIGKIAHFGLLLGKPHLCDISRNWFPLSAINVLLKR